MRSPETQRQRERVVEFEDAPNREGGRVERNSEGGRPSEFGSKGNKIQGTNLPPLLAAHLGRNENGNFQTTLLMLRMVTPLLGEPLPNIYKEGMFHRTAKLRNDILMFQQVNNIKKNLFLKHGLISRNYSKKSLIMASTFGTKSKSFMTMSLPSQDEPLINGRWDFTELVKAISLPQDVPSTSDRHLIELENQVQHLMEAHIASMQLTQVNKITSLCEICSGPHDTQYCMENLEQAFVKYVSSCTDEAGGKWYTFKPEENNFDDTYNPSWKSHPNLRDDGDVMFIEIVKKNDDSRKEEPKAGGLEIMRRKLDPRENSDRGVSNFTGRIKGMHVFVGNFTYVTDFMIVEDISSIIDPRLSQVVLGKPFVEVSNLTHDPTEGVVRFTNETDEITYKMPHMIEQYNSLSDLEKEHTKSVYLRNEEDRRKGVGYVMSKILGFYKECIELGPEYVTGKEDEGEVT
ncbi:hypothetical protein Tco_0741074 [Tanacetum coccineum]